MPKKENKEVAEETKKAKRLRKKTNQPRKPAKRRPMMTFSSLLTPALTMSISTTTKILASRKL
jgi:hypothetical protein